MFLVEGTTGGKRKEHPEVSSPLANGVAKGDEREAGGEHAGVGILLPQVSWVDLPGGLPPPLCGITKARICLARRRFP